MTLCKWSNQISVNIEEIDNQHKQLMQKINKFEDVVSDNMCNNDMRQLFFDLMHYAISHFETEEKYLYKYKYPEYTEHCEAHKRFRKKVVDMNKQIGSVHITV